MGKYYLIVRNKRENSLSHFGILGQKWGVRRYQNEDGTLTEEGKKRYQRQSEQLEGAKYHLKKEADFYEKEARDYDEASKRLRSESFEDAIIDVYGDKKSAYLIDETDDRIKKSIDEVASEYEHKAKVSRKLAEQSRELIKKLSDVKLDGIKDEKQFTKEIADVLYQNEDRLIKYLNMSSLRNDIQEYSEKQKESKKTEADTRTGSFTMKKNDQGQLELHLKNIDDKTKERIKDNYSPRELRERVEDYKDEE